MLSGLIPTHLTGADLERVVVDLAQRYEDAGIGSIGRYGVQAVRMKDDWQIMSSLPDFEGDIEDYHIIFDCKACSQASFSWDKYRSETKGARSRQLRHMRRRSRFGARCFFLFHWNERKLTKRVVPAQTWLLPVDAKDDYWSMVDGAVIRTLRLEDCQDRGIPVQWAVPDRCRKPVPMLLDAIRQLG